MTDDLAPWLASLLGFAVAGAIVLALRPRPSRPAPGAGTAVRELVVPALGGISIFFAVVVASLAFAPLDEAYRGILLGTTVMAITGIVADVRGLPPPVMFLAQVGAAGIAVAYGVDVDRFTFPFVGIVAELPQWADAPLTIAWIVLLVRLVDFVDGLDGLAAAICAAASLTFVVLSLGLGTRGSAILSAVIAGACAGFLVRNFYPARVLLGHTGSLVLGYLVATVAIEGLLKTAAVVGVLLPFLALTVPALDSSLTVATRLLARAGPRAVARETSARLPRVAVGLVLAGWCLVVALSVLASDALEFRAGGEWHRWRTALVALIGLAVLAGSAYVIALLEASRPARRGAAERATALVPPLGAGAASDPSSPAEAIETARTAFYGTSRRTTDGVLRALDVVIAASAFVVLLPLLLLIAGLVVVTSGRPVLHAGTRVGRHGAVFTMRKFRTLRPDAELRLAPFYGAELDRRMPGEVTRVGRVLRATHMDETPQLWNVLVGHMSVVGPRPLRPRFFEELVAEIPQYWQRLTVRPGLTGLAQTRIERGAGWDEKLAHDLEWIADRSVRLYLATVLATAWRVVVATVTLRWRAAEDADGSPVER